MSVAQKPHSSGWRGLQEEGKARVWGGSCRLYKLQEKCTLIKNLSCMAYKRCIPLQHLGSLCETDPSQKSFAKTSVFTDLLTVRMYLNHASATLYCLLCCSPRQEKIQDWSLKSKQECFLYSNVSLWFDNLLNTNIHFGIKNLKIYSWLPKMI